MAEQACVVFDPNKVRERIVSLGKDWSRKNAAAQLAEDMKKTVHARLTLARMADGGCSKAQAELEALASQDYVECLADAAAARQASNDARTEFDCAKIWVDLLRSVNANKRTEMQLSDMG